MCRVERSTTKFLRWLMLSTFNDDARQAELPATAHVRVVIKTVRVYARISTCFCIWMCSRANKDQIWALVNRNFFKALIHSLKALLAAARNRTVH